MIRYTIPADIDLSPEIIDEGFPALRGAPPGTIDLGFFAYIWADFTLWMEYPWNIDINDEIDHDIRRLVKLCRKADHFRLPRITLEIYRRDLVNHAAKDRRKHTRNKPTPHITRLRPIVDGPLDTISDSDLKRMKRKFGKWLREEFTPSMFTQHIEDCERLQRLQHEGQRRNLPEVYKDPLFWLPTWKYRADWSDALAYYPINTAEPIHHLLDRAQLEFGIFTHF